MDHSIDLSEIHSLMSPKPKIIDKEFDNLLKINDRYMR